MGLRRLYGVIEQGAAGAVPEGAVRGSAMSELDRSELIELLERLGDESDEAVLEAARTVHRKLGEAELTWDDLLREEPGVEDDEFDEDEDEEEDEDDWDDEDDNRDREGEDAAVDPVDPVDAKAAGEEARLIDRLLARKDISKDMREELSDLKGDIDDGSFTEMDRRYVRALAKRLGAR